MTVHVNYCGHKVPVLHVRSSFSLYARFRKKYITGLNIPLTQVRADVTRLAAASGCITRPWLWRVM